MPTQIETLAVTETDKLIAKAPVPLQPPLKVIRDGTLQLADAAAKQWIVPLVAAKLSPAWQARIKTGLALLNTLVAGATPTA